MLGSDGNADLAAEIVGRHRVAVLVPCYNEEIAIGKLGIRDLDACGSRERRR